jgi:hypothetical protein
MEISQFSCWSVFLAACLEKARACCSVAAGTCHKVEKVTCRVVPAGFELCCCSQHPFGMVSLMPRRHATTIVIMHATVTVMTVVQGRSTMFALVDQIVETVAEEPIRVLEKCA